MTDIGQQRTYANGICMTFAPIYSLDDLPPGFRYPQFFVDNLPLLEAKNLYPWVFIKFDSDVGRLLLTVSKEAERPLVPFASLETGDGDVACFDGRCTDGTPRIVMLILDGSGRAYGFDSFEHWLRTAEADAAAY
jgi:hypothetical protein